MHKSANLDQRTSRFCTRACSQTAAVQSIARLVCARWYWSPINRQNRPCNTCPPSKPYILTRGVRSGGSGGAAGMKDGLLCAPGRRPLRPAVHPGPPLYIFMRTRCERHTVPTKLHQTDLTSKAHRVARGMRTEVPRKGPPDMSTRIWYPPSQVPPFHVQNECPSLLLTSLLGR